MSKTIDSIWEEIHSNRSWGAYPSEHIIRFIARNYYDVENRGKIKILDYGCGQGANTWYFAREGFDTYAFDGSESAVTKTRDKLGKEGLFASLKVADALDLDYPDNYFDVVVDGACIYCNTKGNIEKMYKDVYRMLKPGGKLLSICFGEQLDGYMSGDEIEPGTYQNIREGVLTNRGLTHIFAEEEVVGLLKSVGFVNVICDWIKYMDNGNLVHQYICSGQK